MRYPFFAMTLTLGLLATASLPTGAAAQTPSAGWDGGHRQICTLSDPPTCRDLLPGEPPSYPGPVGICQIGVPSPCNAPPYWASYPRFGYPGAWWHPWYPYSGPWRYPGYPGGSPRLCLQTYPYICY